MKKQVHVPLLRMDNSAGLARSTLLLRRLRFAVEEFTGPQTIEEFGTMIGTPKSTADRWLNGSALPSGEALLSLLERLPVLQREEVLRHFCREFPTLTHPKLAHDRAAVSHLKTILEQRNGLVLIRGADQDVTFVATALGHSVKRSPGACLGGVDIHKADWFVPVPGIKYLDNVLNPDELWKEFDAFWLRSGKNPPSFIILNGLWPSVPVLRDSVRSVLDQSTVFLTVRARRADVELGLPALTVSVDSPSARSDRLQLEFECTPR